MGVGAGVDAVGLEVDPPPPPPPPLQADSKAASARQWVTPRRFVINNSPKEEQLKGLYRPCQSENARASKDTRLPAPDQAIGASDTAVEARRAVSMNAATSETATRWSDSKRSVMMEVPLQSGAPDHPKRRCQDLCMRRAR
ncbi:hypothetical protein GCM10008023_25720 [Sphingomonas glacialis]|uniref:Uncharacterized protein n=1 Tax=Sphingomonas glacialis TaxID=658225 RepID=A0ABQ3LRP1_9SPHN|nr:hypothetical protein GCM10008023_25720 [Sphingomonas glacialis]